MPGRRRIASLAVIMLVVAGLATTAVVMVLYAASVTAQLQLMEEIVAGRARMLEPILGASAPSGGSDRSRIDQALGLQRHPELAFPGFGESGEWVLVEGDVARPRYRVLGPEQAPGPRSMAPDYAGDEPMRLALAGETGSALARDYRGSPVLAAYAPVGDTGLGLVLKVDRAEVCRPILEAVVVAAITALVAIAGGTALLMWLGSPLVRRVRQEEGNYRTLFESDHDGVLLLAGPERVVVEANRTWWRMLGLDRDEPIAGRRVAEFLSPVPAGGTPCQNEVEELLRRVVVAGPQHVPG